MHEKIIAELLPSYGPFPNHPTFPVLLYKNALHLHREDPKLVEEIFLKNHWKKPWRNGIYDFHHYHSNTHEVLGVYSGTCLVQVGGDQGPKFELEKGDVLILPAGVSHKNLGCSDDFKCVGAYPFEIEFDMNYCKKEEKKHAEQNIRKSPLPQSDPVYGENGPLFKYWK
jgi:uncharacterized protein YjlB